MGRSKRRAFLGALAGTGALAGLTVTGQGAAAATPHLTVTPTSPTPNQRVKITGTVFTPGTHFSLSWDSLTTGVTVLASAYGEFVKNVRVPNTLGQHVLHARRVEDEATLAVTVVATAPTPTPTPTPTPVPTPISTTGLHVVGNKIVGADGSPVQLHGVNRASWEYAAVGDNGDDGWGFCDPDIPVQAEVDAMKDWHVNVVRISLNQSAWLGTPAGMNPQWTGMPYQTAVAEYVALLAENGIASILNLHWNAAGSAVALDQQVMPDRDHSPTFWASVATFFKNHPMVLFEPYNEPHPDGNHDGDTAVAWECWRNGGKPTGISPVPSFTPAGMLELGAAIRATGAQNIIVYTGTNYGSSLRLFLSHVPADSTGQVAAGWHSYDDGLSCQDEACWDTQLAAVLAQYPIIATELGEFTCTSTETVRRMTWLDDHGGHYTPWTWFPGKCTDEPALLKLAADKSNPANWLGVPSGYGLGVRDHMRTRL